jgi:acyl-CoA synthetase (AMP-forming)/AMP-acid ligase II
MTTATSNTVFEAFARTAAAHPDNDFLCVPARADRSWCPDGQTLTYADTARRITTLRDRYHAAGYRAGQRIALLLENRPDFLIHFLSLNALGVSIVPINPDYQADEMAYLLTHSEASLVVSIPERIEGLRTAAAMSGAQLFVMDGTIENPAIPPPRTAVETRVQAGRSTECALLYTSGTTGRPKGCILSNDYFLSSGAGYRDHGGVVAIDYGRDRFYNPLPLFHMNHLALTVTCAILTANCLVLTERFSPARWWPEIRQSGATIVHYLGVVAPMLLNQPATANDHAHKVRFGLGAGIEPALHQIFEKRFNMPMVEVWGMTETGRLFIDAHEPRSISTRAFGRPFAGFDAMVANELGAPVPTGTQGELLVRHSAQSPRSGFFSGYLKDSAATEDAWRGGWFHTGDIVTQDASGLLTFVDRRKNIIRRSGENIAAAEVEAILQTHPDVAQVAVLPVYDETREQEVLAVVVPLGDRAHDEAFAIDLFNWCRERIAYYKAPGWILFREHLPTTGTQKIQKSQIFEAGVDPRTAPGIVDLRDRKKR